MPNGPHDISIDAFDYSLPEERIAKYPLEVRDQSKLLIYREGITQEAPFHSLPERLPEGSLLVFNNTRVIHARLYFTLPNGRRLEILCLEPLLPVEYQQNLSSTQKVQWKCLIGGNRKWKSGEIALTIESPEGSIQLEARRLERLEDAFSVEFEWDQAQLSFGEILAYGGIIPLPPYLNRQSEQADKDRYQTIYAEPEGSVAAPTAGLHFTDAVFTKLDEKHIQRAFVTLHVGAGTFKPVKADTLSGHEMHQESLFVQRSLVQLLVNTLENGKPIIPVGTTSLRTLESLYWLGVRLLRQPGEKIGSLLVGQWFPYEQAAPLPSALDALSKLGQWMDTEQVTQLEGQTQLLIAPGYTSQLIDAIITNFHQPRSTLLLLVAALIGDDWKKVYEFALANDFRFLSYGDSSLLWKNS